MTTGALDPVRTALHAHAEPERVPVLQRFFRTEPGGYGEGDVLIGARVPAVRAVARQFRDVDLDAVEQLLASRVHEERLLALLLLVAHYRRGPAARRQDVYERYLRNTRHVSGWDLVDASAPQVVGSHLLDRPRGVLDDLARSGCVWERRIAVMATFAFVRRGQVDDTVRLARLLLHDEHDLIRKACGWMLREVGLRDRATLVPFLEEHAADMPRTTLRTAVERLDPATRARLMSARRAAGRRPGDANGGP